MIGNEEVEKRRKAAGILEEHGVDSFMDGRSPVEILQDLVAEGHLPGKALGDFVEVVHIATETPAIEV